MSFMNMDQAYVANTYKRFPVEIVSGKGSRVVDINGKSYVDMGSGIGVTAFGFGDEAWMAAVTEQLGKVQHTSNLYYTEPCAKLAKLLCEKTGMKKVFSAIPVRKPTSVPSKLPESILLRKRAPTATPL